MMNCKYLSIVCILITIFILLSSCSLGSFSNSSSSIAHDAYLDLIRARFGTLPNDIFISSGNVFPEYDVDLSGFLDDGFYINAKSGEVIILAKNDSGLDRAVRDFVKHGNYQNYFKTYDEGYRIKKFTISGNDISDYSIIIPDGCEKVVKTAGDTLADYIRKSCGAVVPVYYDSSRPNPEASNRYIFITSGDETLGDEGFIITVDDFGDLHIDGGVWRGCLYGVYDLLEDIGWRCTGNYFVPDYSRLYLYASDHVDLTSEINRTEIPSVSIRGGFDYLFNKNTYSSYLSDELGGYGFSYQTSHGLQRYHNQIFSGEFEGLYLGWDKTGRQPCMNDDNILEAIDTFVLNFVSTRLDVGQTIGKEITDIDLSQWDSAPGDFCTCKKCMSVYRVEGNHCGSFLRMANREGALLDEYYPGVTVSILAYYGTDDVPKVTTPAHNVIVSYCFFMGENYIQCSNHCISGVDCDPSSQCSNVIAARRFEKWVEVMDPKNIQVWYYPLNWRKVLYDSPVHSVLLEDMKYLVSKGVGHVYLCTTEAKDGVTNVELSKYLCGKYLWDASVTEEESQDLIREWYNIVYGEAGDLIYYCASLMEYAGDQAGCWGVISPTDLDHVNYEYISHHANEIWNLYKSAVSLADTAEQQTIIENYMAGVMYLVTVACYDSMYINGDESQRTTLKEWYSEVYRIFRDHRLPIRCDTYNIASTAVYLEGEVDFDVNPHTWLYDD